MQAANENVQDRIEVNDPADMEKWAKKLGISVSQLAAIIKVVGDSPSAVQGEIATQ